MVKISCCLDTQGTSYSVLKIYYLLYICMEFNAAVIMLSLQLNIPYKCIVNTKSSKRCNLCPECPNITKFSPQSNFSMNISILGFISAEHEDKRKRKNARIGEYVLYLRVFIFQLQDSQNKALKVISSALCSVLFINRGMFSIPFLSFFSGTSLLKHPLTI